ncbi:hypothetical protein M8C21_032332, partial [Ambrosia artemisiifolia]
VRRKWYRAGEYDHRGSQSGTTSAAAAEEEVPVTADEEEAVLFPINEEISIAVCSNIVTSTTRFNRSQIDAALKPIIMTKTKPGTR